ncbi:hypothetical protein [Nocardia cyriacigeorgica]|uniref:hypothetical protein n=1 Tax=Nocardia cyriacigeorgica TaxID=135487 RepID=UPI002455EF74|nr:hypothetical protein [Nocardia cyriacigeorgica]
MPDPIADLHRYIHAIRDQPHADPRNTIVCLTAGELHDALIATRKLERDLADAKARLARVDALTTGPGGIDYAHLPGCRGEDDCPACWTNRILVALDPGGDIRAAQQTGTGDE